MISSITPPALNLALSFNRMTAYKNVYLIPQARYDQYLLVQCKYQASACFSFVSATLTLTADKD